ncbi:MAG: hypothetical protein ACOYJJ_09355 [Anaerovoracaceae bacterium]|jgi:hypothetical protein
MALLDKIQDVAKTVGDNASDTIETTRQKSRISSEKKQIALAYQQIGEIYYEKHMEEGLELIEDAMPFVEEIGDHKEEIKDAEKIINELKGEKL